MEALSKWIATTVLASCFAMNVAAEEPPRLNEVKLIDLSHTYDETTLFWPNSPIEFEHNQLAFGPSGNGYFYSAYTFATPEHGGTHLDAPIHFAENGKSVEALSVDDLFAPLIIIDVTPQAKSDRNYRLSLKDVELFEKTHGKIPKGSAVFVRTGWSRFWPDAKPYLGDDTPGDASNLSFPGFGADAAQALVDRKIKLIGIDTASIDYGKTKDFPVHVIIGTANIPALENLANLDSIPATGAYLMAMPMKIGGGSGAPARVVALVKK